MQPLIRRELDGARAIVSHSTRADGDLSPSTVGSDELARRRARAVPHEWCWVRQVHSDRVVAVEEPTAQTSVADALVTRTKGVALAVHAGDCVPVGFISDAHGVAAAHAGWKGLEAGVLESTVRRLRNVCGDAPVVAVVGPHIRKDRYEFGVDDLGRLQNRFGTHVATKTADGRPALDMTAALATEFDRLGVDVAQWSDDCTARDADRYWSHRARQEAGRIALVAWLE